MRRFLADENFNNRILRGLRREISDIDILRVQDTHVYQADLRPYSLRGEMIPPLR